MKILTWCKVVISGCLSLTILLSTMSAKHGQCISSEHNCFKLKKLKSEKDIIKDATQRIKESFKNPGHPSSIRCTYTLSGSNAISTTTKIYYGEYRKRPDYLTESYRHDAAQADKVVEVFYKKHAKSLSLNIKNTNHKHDQINKKVKIQDPLTA